MYLFSLSFLGSRHYLRPSQRLYLFYKLLKVQFEELKLVPCAERVGQGSTLLSICVQPQNIFAFPRVFYSEAAPLQWAADDSWCWNFAAMVVTANKSMKIFIFCFGFGINGLAEETQDEPLLLRFVRFYEKAPDRTTHTAEEVLKHSFNSVCRLHIHTAGKCKNHIRTMTIINKN